MITDPQSSTLGELIRFQRQMRGWDQRDLARRIDVTQAAVSRWECDDSVPESARVLLLADVLGVERSVLVQKANAARESRRAAA